MGKYQFFTDEEVQGLDDRLCQMLSVARGKADVPFIITSGLRTSDHNADLPESVKDSSHLRGLAVDLACPDSRTRYLMLSSLLAAGFNRIGVYSAHLHADCDSSLPPNVIWYVEGT
jgi:uncharacterized protein YcbK (DUF882 family)